MLLATGGSGNSGFLKWGAKLSSAVNGGLFYEFVFIRKTKTNQWDQSAVFQLEKRFSQKYDIYHFGITDKMRVTRV